MGKLIFGKLLLFALISIMFLHFTEMNAQYNRTVPQRQSRTNVSIDGNELLGRLFKKNKDKEKSKKEKNDKKAKEKKGDVDNSLRNEKDATTRIVEPQLKESSPLAKDEVSLIVSGDGSTKEEATKAALRSAIELAFGTFVSANTKILNDELVKDEIITVSSGNVKNYKYLSEREEDGKYYVSLQTTVAVGKLIEYTKSKGASAELAGATFAMNMKMKRLAASNVDKTIDILEQQITPLLNNCFSYDEIKVEEPVLRQGDVYVTIEIYAKPNSNLVQARNIADNTANALAEHLTPPYDDYLGKEAINSKKRSVLYRYLSQDYALKHPIGTKERFAAEIKGLANMYIPLESILKFKVVDDLGEYSFYKLNQWIGGGHVIGGGCLIGCLKSDKRINNISLDDSSKLKQRKDGQWPGNPLGASDFFDPLHKKYENNKYNIDVLKGRIDIAYVIELELKYTEDEISKITEIKVLPINEFKQK